ncbi:MAG: Type secretion basal body protein YscI, HrpB, PscI [Pseudomonadota bacterium]|jgi:hypothetical protein
MNPLYGPSGAVVPTSGGVAPAVAADDPVAERFRQAMQSPDQEGINAPASQADPVPSGGSRAAPTTLGDGILSTLNTVGTDLQVSWAQVKEGLATSEGAELLSTSELMTLQFKMLSFNALNEVVSKGVAKATQDLDQLLKTQ